MSALDELDRAIYEALSGSSGSVVAKQPPRAPSRTMYRCEPRFLMPKNIALEIAYALDVRLPRPIPILVRIDR